MYALHFPAGMVRLGQTRLAHHATEDSGPMAYPHEWNFFERKTDRERMWILLDTSWLRRTADPKRPWLVAVTVNTYGTSERMAGKAALVSRIVRFERGLEEFLERRHGAVYVARLNTESRLEYYFYARDCVGFAETAGAIERALVGWRVHSICREDADWSFYKYLEPNELERLLIRNAVILESLQARGDTAAARVVSHRMRFSSEASMASCLEAVRRSGYREVEAGRIDRVDEGAPAGAEAAYQLVVCKKHRLDLDTLNAVVRELYELASAERGHYVGWGAALKPGIWKRLGVFLKRIGKPVLFVVLAVLLTAATAIGSRFVHDRLRDGKAAPEGNAGYAAPAVPHAATVVSEGAGTTSAGSGVSGRDIPPSRR